MTLFFLIGCGKDGAIGPQGETGEKGEKGEKGINGANGSTIYSGKAVPNTVIGANGDFYLNLSNGDLYGPKSSEGWGKPFSLKGASGAPGATILSGEVDPATNIGKEGDFYINLKDMTLFGPKNKMAWGSPISLKSDSQNGIKIYVIRPIFDKNVNSTYVSGSGHESIYNLKASTKMYSIPECNSCILDQSFAIKSREISSFPPFFSPEWKLFKQGFDIGSLKTSLDNYVLGSTITLKGQAPLNINSNFDFNFTISGATNYKVNPSIDLGDVLQIRIRAIPGDKYVFLSKNIKDVDRFLRINRK